MNFISKKNKYGNKVVDLISGERFDSKKEYARWCELKLMEQGGLIEDLQRQVPFVLIDKSKYGRAITYVADFYYLDCGKRVVEDVKSEYTKTLPVYRLKKRLFAERYGELGLEITES